MINKSVYRISLDGDVGPLFFEGHKLTEHKDFITNEVRGLWPDREASITFEQRLSAPEVNLIKGLPNGKFEFDKVILHVKGFGPCAEHVKPHRVTISPEFRAKLGGCSDRKTQAMEELSAEMNRIRETDAEMTANVQQRLGLLHCFLTDDINQQIDGANVTLENDTTGRQYSGTTNSGGELKITVPEGVYTARISAPGHCDLVEAVNVDDLTYLESQLQTEPETKRKREIRSAENAIQQITKYSEQGSELLMRARLNPDAGKYLVDEVDTWIAESAECVARCMGYADKTIFLSESPIEVYNIDAATSAHRNLLNRINTKVVRLNRMLQQLSEQVRYWSE